MPRKMTEVLRDGASAQSLKVAAQVEAGEKPDLQAFCAMLRDIEVGALANFGSQRQIRALCLKTDHGRALVEELGIITTLLIE